MDPTWKETTHEIVVGMIDIVGITTCDCLEKYTTIEMIQRINYSVGRQSDDKRKIVYSLDPFPADIVVGKKNHSASFFHVAFVAFWGRGREALGV